MTDRLVYFNRRLHAFLSDSSLGMVSSILTEKGSKSRHIDLDLLGSKRSLIWYLPRNVRSLTQMFEFFLFRVCSFCLIRQKVLQMWQRSVFSNSERQGFDPPLRARNFQIANLHLFDQLLHKDQKFWGLKSMSSWLQSHCFPKAVKDIETLHEYPLVMLYWFLFELTF